MWRTARTAKGGIRGWVFAAVLLAGGIPLVVIYFVASLMFEKEFRRESENVTQKLSDQLARQISTLVHRTSHDVIALARAAGRANFDSDHVKSELRRFHNMNQMIAGIDVLDRDGLLIEASTEGTGRVQDQTAWFKQALDGAWGISSPRRLRGGDQLYVSVYAPVRIETSRARVVRISVSLNPLCEIVSEAAVEDGGEVFLVDSEGRLLGRKGGAGLLQVAPEHVLAAIDPKREAEADETITASVAAVEGLEDSPLRGWQVVWCEQRSALNATGERFQEMVVWAFLLAVLLSVLAGLQFARVIGKPLERLSDMSLRAAAGELEGRVPMNGPTEVQELGWAFNRMLVELKKSRGVLEEQVRERTRSLEDARAEEARLAQELSACFEATPEGVLVLGLDGNVLEANRRMEEFFGTDFHGARGDSPEGLVEVMLGCFDDKEGFRQRWKEGRTRGEGDEWRMRSGGEERVLRVCASPVADKDGEVFARLWMFRDVTGQKVLERGLQQAQKMEAVGQLAGGIAHDFNNLLTGIDGNLALVELDDENVLSGSGTEAMSMARQSCGRAAGLVRGLLGYSRQSCLEKVRFAPNRLVEDTVKLLRVTIDRRVHIETEADATVGDVDVDVAQVQQIVMNLSLNAKDAMPDGGTLWIRTRAEIVDVRSPAVVGVVERRPGSYVVIEIEDEGSGIGADIRGRIFEPFFTTKETGKGTGLGLAMANGIAHQHGGWIECESEPGRGAKFSVYLPELMPVEETDVPRAGAPEAEALLGGGDDERLRVLVADDEFVVRAVAEGLLRKMGHEVTGVVNGAEAVQVCRERGDELDLVLLDMTMPVMSGKEALEIMKAECPDLPVVICSGFSLDIASFGEGGAARPDLVVQKPYSPAQLESAIREAVPGLGVEIPA